jgi:hypothetical protein
MLAYIWPPRVAPSLAGYRYSMALRVASSQHFVCAGLAFADWVTMSKVIGLGAMSDSISRPEESEGGIVPPALSPKMREGAVRYNATKHMNRADRGEASPPHAASESSSSNATPTNTSAPSRASSMASRSVHAPLPLQLMGSGEDAAAERRNERRNETSAEGLSTATRALASTVSQFFDEAGISANEEVSLCLLGVTLANNVWITALPATRGRVTFSPDDACCGSSCRSSRCCRDGRAVFGRFRFDAGQCRALERWGNSRPGIPPAARPAAARPAAASPAAALES